MDQEVNTMDSVVVSKDQLLAKIEENRTTHIKLYNAAMSGYFIAVEQELEEKVVQFREDINQFEEDFEEYQSKVDESVENREKADHYFRLGFSKFSTSFKAEFPTSFESEYNAAIQKVKMSAYPKVRLTHEEFMRYVMNDWSWKSEFKKSLVSNINCMTGTLGSQHEAYALFSGASFY